MLILSWEGSPWGTIVRRKVFLGPCCRASWCYRQLWPINHSGQRQGYIQVWSQIKYLDTMVMSPVWKPINKKNKTKTYPQVSLQSKLVFVSFYVCQTIPLCFIITIVSKCLLLGGEHQWKSEIHPVMYIMPQWVGGFLCYNFMAIKFKCSCLIYFLSFLIINIQFKSHFYSQILCTKYVWKQMTVLNSQN